MISQQQQTEPDQSRPDTDSEPAFNKVPTHNHPGYERAEAS
jgi:hypothetical protein